MSFITKINLQDNRQHRLPKRKSNVLSGTTVFGTTFNNLNSGPDLSNFTTSGNLNTGTTGTYSGNTDEVILNINEWGMNISVSQPPIDGIYTAQTYESSAIFNPIGINPQTIDGNTSYLNYTGVTFEFELLNFSGDPNSTYTGDFEVVEGDYLSAGTLDYTGRTIWSDVKGILKTEDIIISNGTSGATAGYVLTSDSEGKGVWLPSSGSGSFNCNDLNGCPDFTQLQQDVIDISGATSGGTFDCDVLTGCTQFSDLENNISSISGDVISINEDVVTLSGDVTSVGQDIVSISGDVVNISAATSGQTFDCSDLSGCSVINNIQNDIINISGDTGGGGTFTGNTSGSCINDFYVENIYGCEDITVHNSIQHTGSTAGGELSVAFGKDNTIDSISNYSSILGGKDNKIQFNGDTGDSMKNNSIIGGFKNEIICSPGVGGEITTDRNVIIGGGWNEISSDSGTTSSVIIGGEHNTVTGDNSVVIGGTGIIGDGDKTVYVPNLVIDGIGAGPLYTTNSGLISGSTSDIRLKENIKPLSNSIDKITQLDGVSFEFTEESDMGKGTRFGFIAQDVQKVIPDVVRLRNKNNDILSLDYTEIIPWTVEAIKDIVNGNVTINNDVFETQTIVSEDNNIELNYGGDNETATGGGISVSNSVIGGEDSFIKVDESGKWVVGPSMTTPQLTLPEYTPTSSSDSNGESGDVVWDDDYIFIKTNSGWKRTKLETF